MTGTKRRITAKGLEQKAEAMLRAYLGSGFGMLQAVNMERMASEYFGLAVRYEPLSAAGNLQAVSVFQETTVRFANGLTSAVAAGTILVDTSLRSAQQRGKRNPAIARECVRQLLFWKEPDAEARAAKLFPMRSAIVPQELRSSCGVCEWEVNTLAAALLMPAAVVNTLLGLFYGGAPVRVYGRGQLSEADRRLLDTLAALLGVTRSALILRLWQLNRIAVLPSESALRQKCAITDGFSAAGGTVKGEQIGFVEVECNQAVV